MDTTSSIVHQLPGIPLLYKTHALHGSLQADVKNIATQPSHRQRWALAFRAGTDGFAGTIALVLPLPKHSQGVPWFLFPGYFYGQGRVDPKLRYPALGEDKLESWSSSTWDFALERAAFPLLLAKLENQWIGLDWSPHYAVNEATDFEAKSMTEKIAYWGDAEPQIGAGITWREGDPLSREMRLNIPANEGPRRQVGHRRDGPTQRTLTLAPGASITFPVGFWQFSGDAMAYQQPIEMLYDELRKSHAPAPLVPAAELGEAAVHGLKQWHWIEEPGYMTYTTPFHAVNEQVANAKGVTLGRHLEPLGFCGGFPVAFGLLWHDQNQKNATDQSHHAAKNEARRIALKMIERMCRDGQTDWGLFRTGFHPGAARTRNGSFAQPQPVGAANADSSGNTPFYGSLWLADQALVHARTTADASHFLARCLQLLRSDVTLKSQWQSWRNALRKSLEVALSLQGEDGRFGQYYDVIHRTIAQQQGAGGLLWIAAMDHAISLFEDDATFQQQLLTAMHRGGEAYAPDVRDQWICGAPEDVSLSPTSEDGYNAIMSYAALFRRFGRAEDLTLWQSAANWTLSFRKAYNVQFDPRCELAAFRTVGGDFASVNNNHLHLYGMCCLADLYELSRITGNDYYACRADDHFAFATQQLCLTAGHWGGQRGMCDEQFYSTEWSTFFDWDPGENHIQKGTICGFSHSWCVNMILLGLEQRLKSGR